MYKWMILFLMIPVIAMGQYAAPSEGTTNADSLQGRPLPPNSSPSDNQLLKVDTTPDPDTFYWANDNSAAGGDTALFLAAANGVIPYVNMTGDTVWVTGATAGFDDVHLRAKGVDYLVLWPDTIIISGDRINDFAGTGLTVVSNVLTADLGTSVEYGEITATTSANWATRVSDETGTGLWAFATSPTFTTNIISPLVIGGTATTSDLTLQTTSGVGETGADMHFLVGTDGGTEAMTILNDGKVGIGETSPYFHLIVAENSGTDGPTIGMKRIDDAVGINNRIGRFAVMGGETGTGNTIVGSLCIDSDSGWTSTSSPTRMEFSTTNDGSTVGTEKMRITNDGNIGIGETSPDEKLHVTGNSATLKLEDDSGNWGSVNIGNSQICLAIDPDDLVASSDICFDIDGSEVARFHASTNFGVGTLGPPERISVVGNIATGDTTTGDVDVYHYFSIDASWVTEYLKWDDGVGRFEISDDFDIGGNLTLSGTATLGTVAGAIDAGSATSLEIPNSDNPTTDANGEIAADNNSNALEVYIPLESESGLISFYKQISIPIVLPDSVQAYVPDLKVWQVNALVHPFGIEIDSVSIQLDADAAYSMILEEWSGADPPVYQNAISTVTTGGTDTYAAEAPDTDAAIDAGDWIVLDMPTTDVPVVTVGIIYHVTEGN